MQEFIKFTPGEYLPFEKDLVQQRLDIAAGKGTSSNAGGPRPDGTPKPFTEAEIIAYNKKWDPYNPLFNDPEYARKAGYSSVPAYPGFAGRGAMGVPGFPKNMADFFCYTNDGTDLRQERPIVAGDLLTTGETHTEFYEVKEPGSDLRQWYIGGTSTLVDQNGTLVVTGQGNVRDCYKKYVSSEKPYDFVENMTAWLDYFPAPHYTTDEDWEKIRAMWAKEEIRGADPRYWEDVQIGTFMTPTCHGPVTYMHMAEWYGSHTLSRRELCDKKVLETTFRDANGNYLFETAVHLGTRTVPNGRMVWYNDTGARLIARTVTNWIGDSGYVNRFCWRFFPFFKEMRTWKPHDYDLLSQVVPGYENRLLNRHGSEGDTCIGKAYVYDKYIDEVGRHCIKICAWAETLDGDVVQICPMEAVLPSRA